MRGKVLKLPRRETAVSGAVGWEIVAPTMLLHDLIEKNALYFPQKDFLIDGERKISFRDFRDRVRKLAGGLVEAGLRRGDRVATLLPNCIELLETYFATLKAGGIIVPINVYFSAKEVSDILEHSDPRIIIARGDYGEKLDSDTLQVAGRRLFFVGETPSGEQGYEALFLAETLALPTDLKDEDVAAIIYTSGTTGRPKGVMLTHRNLLCVAWATCVTRQIDEHEVSLISAPLFQAAAFGSMTGNLLRGCTIVLQRGFDPTLVLEAIERHKVSSSLFVPAMLVRLIESADVGRYDLSSFKTAIYGAAPMPVDLLKRLLSRFRWQFIGAYGATETGPAYITVLRPEDHVLDGDPKKEQRLRSVGREGINARVRIVDELDRSVPPGEIGEIAVRGPHIMKGYWKDPEETSRVLRGGWYHTGDVGFMDEEGYVFLVDRKKDVIITGGFNVYPREIEDALLSHPSIAEAAVIGVPHPVWGETPRAYVVLKPGAHRPEEKEVLEFLRNRLASFKLPRGGVRFLSSLPRNASGKVLKEELRNLAKTEIERSH